MELSFTDCRVCENMLGVRGRGYAQFLQTFDEGRIAIAALCVGLAQGCVDESIAYAKERPPPARRSAATGHRVQDRGHGARVHTARLAYYHAAERMCAGEPFKKEAAIAKLVASNAAMDNAGTPPRSSAATGS